MSSCLLICVLFVCFFFFKQKTAYEVRISGWSSDVCSSDLLSPLERQMGRNLLHCGERDAGDVGVPRADIIAVEQGISFDDLVRTFASAGHSRLPVYRDALDTIIGMVHIKDEIGRAHV